jgi:putative transposase
MMATVTELKTKISMQRACDVLGLPRCTAYRWQQPPIQGPRRPRKSSRALDANERKQVLEVLCSEKFTDKAPATIKTELLDEDRQYLCSTRTMYRILDNQKAVKERRKQRTHPQYSKPELMATAPNQVWSWDVTWLRGPTKGKHYPLYVVLDLYSKFNPGWMLAHEENGALAKELMMQTCKRQGIDSNQLTIHADRGPVPKGKTMHQLMLDLEITPSFSRPRVSNETLFPNRSFVP